MRKALYYYDYFGPLGPFKIFRKSDGAVVCTIPFDDEPHLQKPLIAALVRQFERRERGNKLP